MDIWFIASMLQNTRSIRHIQGIRHIQSMRNIIEAWDISVIRCSDINIFI